MTLNINRQNSLLLQTDDIYFYDYIYYPVIQTLSASYNYIDEFRHYYEITQDYMYNCFKEYYKTNLESYKINSTFNSELTNIATKFSKNIQIAFHYIVIQKKQEPILADKDSICLILYTYKDITKPNLIDIYNVCAGSACKGKKIVSNDGTQHSIVKIILGKIFDLYQNEKISLFVDFIKNPKPIETCGLYVSLGFGNPRLSKRLNIDILSGYPQLRLDLTPTTKEYNKVRKEKILENIIKIGNKFISTIKDYIIRIQISKNIFEYLEQIITDKKHEVCGLFQLSNQVNIDELGIKSYNLVYICDYENYGTGTLDSKNQIIPSGFQFLCNTHKAPITYHTHPKSYNIERHNKFGFFSAGDLIVYLTNICDVWYRGNEQMADPYNMLFFVYSNEGLYSLQGNENLSDFFNKFNFKQNEYLQTIFISLFLGVALTDMTELFPLINIHNIAPYEYINIINRISLLDLIITGYTFLREVTNISNYEDPNSFIYNKLKQFKQNGQYNTYIRSTVNKILSNSIIKNEFNHIFNFLDIIVENSHNYENIFKSGVGINILILTKNIRTKLSEKSNIEKIINKNLPDINIIDPIFITNFIPDFTENKDISFSEIYYYNIPNAILLQENLLTNNMFENIVPPVYPKYGIDATTIKDAKKEGSLPILDLQCKQSLTPNEYRYII
jgi:hypothetical protein